MSDRRHSLHALADRCGILPAYIDTRGEERTTTDDAREAVLTAMGMDVSTDALARTALTEREANERARMVEPTVVLRAGVRSLPVRLPDSMTGRVEWRVEVITDSGDRREVEGTAGVRAGQRTVNLTLPAGLDAGYYSARIHLTARGVTHDAETFVMMSPRSCVPLRDVIGTDRVFGLIANLYTVRSADNWGAGDTSDLGALVEWSGRVGADFVGINPLHALRNRDGDISPYSPVTRLFNNPLYVNVGAVPEFEASAAARSIAKSAATRSALARLRAADAIDYGAVMDLRRPVLEALYASFVDGASDGGGARRRAYDDYVWRRGRTLTDFATFCALGEHLAQPDWRTWADRWRDPRSAEVARFRDANEDAVGFHAWIQFELDRQLGAVAAKATAAGLRLGVYGDLALGSSVSGSDRWSFGNLFAEGITVGAPPDDYAPHGQDWGFPPIDPQRLSEDRYRYWILLIRNALSHFGALRIDHVMGLFRQFWIPTGMTGEHGAYVSYPAAGLLAVLAIESRRRGAIIIGEDLGTVPRGLSALLARRNILSTRVLYFERARDGRFRSSRSWSSRALATVNTHDHAPLAGFWVARDIEARHEAGDLDEAEFEAALARREIERRALLDRLVAERLVDRDRVVEPVSLRNAVHAFLARTPAPLVGLTLDDVAGETEPVNLPGVTADRFPSWTRRMRIPLEVLFRDATAMRSMDAVRVRVRGIAG